MKTHTVAFARSIRRNLWDTISRNFKPTVTMFVLYAVLLQSFAFGAVGRRDLQQRSPSISLATSFSGSVAFATDILSRVAGLMRVTPDASQTEPTDLTLTAFTTKRFTRTTGAPNNYVETFTMPAECSSGSFRLYIKNGEPTGANRISSAEIS
jgi:hypothetical protein